MMATKRTLANVPAVVLALLTVVSVIRAEVAKRACEKCGKTGVCAVFCEKSGAARKDIKLPVYFLREVAQLRVKSDGNSKGRAALLQYVGLCVVGERGKEDKYDLVLRDRLPATWKPRLPIGGTITTKKLYGEPYTIPIKVSSEGLQSVPDGSRTRVDYQLKDLPGAPWRADVKCQDCTGEAGCDKRAVVQFKASSFSDACEVGKWAQVWYAVKPMVLKAGKPNVVELTVAAKTFGSLEKATLALNANQQVGGGGNQACTAGCCGKPATSGCGPSSGAAKAPVFTMKPTQWDASLHAHAKSSPSTGLRTGACGCGSGAKDGVLTRTLARGMNRSTIRLVVTPTRPGIVSIPNVVRVTGTLKAISGIPEIDLVDTAGNVLSGAQVVRSQTFSLEMTSGISLRVTK